MNTIKYIIIIILLSGLVGSLKGQTFEHLKNQNWKLNEQYVDSLESELNDIVYLFLDDNGTLMSDSIFLDPSSAQFQQRGLTVNSYNFNNQPVYEQDAISALDLIIDGETKKYDILYEDANNLILFKYDTIILTSDSLIEPIIYPNELRLIKAPQ